MSNSRNLIVTLIILAAIAVAAAWYWRDDLTVALANRSAAVEPGEAGPAAEPASPAPASGEGVPAQIRPAAATVEPARMAEMLAQVPVSGTLVARQEVQIYPQVSGFEIRELLVEAGDTVAAGQVLARLSDDTLKAQVSQAEAEMQRAEAGLSQARSQIASGEAGVAQATAALDRVRRLQQSGNASQAALDQAVSADASARAAAASANDGVLVAQAQLAQARAARDVAALDLARTQITAPVAGLVSARTAELGAIAGTATEPMFTIIANGEIEVAAEVIETALDQLEEGDPAAMRIAGVGEVGGSVRLVPAAVDPVTRLGILRIRLDPDPGLRTGLFASGWITTDRRQTLTVPSTAILSLPADGGDAVQLVQGNRVATRPVTTGLLWDGRREIVDGLSDGELVVSRAPAFYRDGDAIEPVPPEGQTANATQSAPDSRAATDAPGAGAATTAAEGTAP